MSELVDLEPIEGYCVSCKQKGDIEDPIAVWTSKGQAATKGVCPSCGANVFRMGRTHLHGSQSAPTPVQVIPGNARKRAKAAYIAAAVTDAEFAQKLGEDLEKVGVYTWVDRGEKVDTVSWSGGVHPALEQCTHLVVVLSSFTENTESVRSAWEYFLQQRKPVIVAQTENIDPPDEIRSRPRYNFADDTKTAFRGLVEMLSR